MKEILKYLRTINSFSQEKVAKEIGISRQSYNKYETGAVIPSDKILVKIAALYNVETDFLKENKIPDLPGMKNTTSYNNISKKFSDLYVSSTAPAYKANNSYYTETLDKPVENLSKKQFFKAHFIDGVIIPDDKNLHFTEGQEIQFCINDSAESEKLKEKAWNTIQGLIGQFKLPAELENLSYDKIREKALEEKYGKY